MVKVYKHTHPLALAFSNRKLWRKALAAFWLCVPFLAIGHPEMHCQFLERAARPGQMVRLVMTLHYPCHEVYLLPDSSYHYAPFTLIKKEIFQTKMKASWCFDSIVYHLQQFEVSGPISYQLPAYQIKSGDSAIFFPVGDSLRIVPYLSSTDSLEIKDWAGYVLLPEKWEYKKTAAKILGFLLGLGIVYFLIGKWLSRRVRLIRLFIEHRRYIQEYKKQSTDFKALRSAQILEALLINWKNYLSKIEDRNFQTLTTTELMRDFEEYQEIRHLQTLDRYLYGGVYDQEVDTAIQQIHRFAEFRFNRRRKSLSNG